MKRPYRTLALPMWCWISHFPGYQIIILLLFSWWWFSSPYSDVAVLPILAFFFCSAGPFLCLIFLLRKAASSIRTRLTPTNRQNDQLDRATFKIVENNEFWFLFLDIIIKKINISATYKQVGKEIHIRGKILYNQCL